MPDIEDSQVYKQSQEDLITELKEEISSLKRELHDVTISREEALLDLTATRHGTQILQSQINDLELQLSMRDQL